MSWWTVIFEGADEVPKPVVHRLEFFSSNLVESKITGMEEINLKCREQLIFYCWWTGRNKGEEEWFWFQQTRNSGGLSTSQIW